MRPRLVPKAANWFFITVGSVGCELRQRERTHDGEERVQTNRELPSCFYQSGSESGGEHPVGVTEIFHVSLSLLFGCWLRITFSWFGFLEKNDFA